MISVVITTREVGSCVVLDVAVRNQVVVLQTNASRSLHNTVHSRILKHENLPNLTQPNSTQLSLTQSNLA